MKTLHLFAGAGGGILADLILGHEPTHAVEIDPYACTILRERFPGMSVHEGDIRGMDFQHMAGIDAICAGFPCQDISAAGKGSGITGERSGLFSEVMRAIDALRPAWVLLENSPLIRTRGRHIVIGELVARGYSWRDGLLSASDVGAPHKRNRWWCLARLANPPCQRLEISQPSETSDELAPLARSGRRANWWSAEPGFLRVAHGVANRAQRIKSIGNGQVPLCAAVAWRLLGGP